MHLFVKVLGFLGLERINHLAGRPFGLLEAARRFCGGAVEAKGVEIALRRGTHATAAPLRRPR